MIAEQNNQDQNKLDKKKRLTTKLLNTISQNVNICLLSKELGKSVTESMNTLLNVVHDMLEKNQRHIVKDGIEVSMWKRKVKGLGNEVVVDIYCNKFMHVDGIWV